ncbi:MAG: zinc dependent phospholipase C family protein [Butyricicoccaceae bacterium]
MPAFVSHYRFASEVLANARPEISKAVSDAPAAFYLGAQGPDILFYHHIGLPSQISAVGHAMHTARTARAFAAFVREAARLNTPEATSYLLGLCCHYALDRTVHPFVNYISNQVLNPLYPEKSPSALHNLCECDLDRMVVERHFGEDVGQFRSPSLLDLDKKAVEAASHMMANTAWTVYGVRCKPAAIASSLRSMKRVLSILHDKNGSRAAQLAFIDRITGSHGLYSSLVRPLKPIPADCANLSRNAWIDAEHPRMRRYDTYFDLMRSARPVAYCLMDHCLHCMQTGDPINPALFRLNYSGVSAPEEQK